LIPLGKLENLRNNAEQWKNNENTMKETMGLPESAPSAASCSERQGLRSRQQKTRHRAMAGDYSHKSETRISAFADLARKGKRENKALLLSL